MSEISTILLGANNSDVDHGQIDAKRTRINPPLLCRQPTLLWPMPRPWKTKTYDRICGGKVP
jgi:hypothetical protein